MQIRTRGDFFEILNRSNSTDLFQLLKNSSLEESVFLKWISEYEKKNSKIQRDYYENGKIVLRKKENPKTSPILNLRISPNQKVFRAVALSDTHLHSSKENFRYLDFMSEHVIKSDIHTIFHTGDICDQKKEATYYKQEPTLEYICKYYPKLENVITYLVLGNHDLYCFERSKQISSAIEYLYQNRPDLVGLAYQRAIIQIQKNKVMLYHKISNEMESYRVLKEKEISMVLSGHFHVFSIENLNPLVLRVPTCSDVVLGNFSHMKPGFLEMKLNLEDGKFQTGIFKRYSFLEEGKLMQQTGEFAYNFQTKKQMVRKKIYIVKGSYKNENRK